MAHHGSDPFGDDPENIKAKRETFDAFKKSMMDTTAFRGALGDFPEGQLTKSDEGALQFGITVKDGKVVLDFGTPVAWVGMTPQQAADLASIMMKRAREAARLNGEMVSFTIG
jgi:hypothetical protein